MLQSLSSLRQGTCFSYVPLSSSSGSLPYRKYLISICWVISTFSKLSISQDHQRQNHPCQPLHGLKCIGICEADVKIEVYPLTGEEFAPHLEGGIMCPRKHPLSTVHFGSAFFGTESGTRRGCLCALRGCPFFAQPPQHQPADLWSLAKELL